MSLRLIGDGFGCSKHGTYVYLSSCEECVKLQAEFIKSQDRMQEPEEMPENDMAPLNPSAFELLERMQTPEAREGMKRAFDATPEELAEAAVEFARKQKEEKK
jgi:hypothetical protein